LQILVSDEIKINTPTVATIPKSNNKIEERSKIDTPITQIRDRVLPWLGTGTSIKSGRVKLVRDCYLTPSE